MNHPVCIFTQIHVNTIEHTQNRFASVCTAYNIRNADFSIEYHPSLNHSAVFKLRMLFFLVFFYCRLFHVSFLNTSVRIQPVFVGCCCTYLLYFLHLLLVENKLLANMTHKLAQCSQPQILGRMSSLQWRGNVVGKSSRTISVVQFRFPFCSAYFK